MENLVFVIWMICYPLASVWSELIGAKKRKIEGLEPYSEETRALAALANIVIWWGVGGLLF